MKKLLLISMIIFLFISCKEENKVSFLGFGDLSIGKSFDSIPSFKLFNKINDNEFQLNKFEISKNIGYVENVVVKTFKGKIYDVKFSTGKFTNESEIDSQLLVEAKKDSEELIIGSTNYSSNKSGIMINKTTFDEQGLATSDSAFKTEYSYSDVLIAYDILEKQKKENDSIAKEKYLKDVKKL